MPNTREKLIELLNEAEEYEVNTCMFHNECEDCPGRKYGDNCRDCLKADHLIANGVTIREHDCHWATEQAYKNGYEDGKPKWIPVTERLPGVASVHNTRWDKSTDSIRVLCACVQADGKKMVKEGYCKVYSDGYVHWKIPGTIHSVTHWMPLPQPPKEG